MVSQKQFFMNMHLPVEQLHNFNLKKRKKKIKKDILFLVVTCMILFCLWIVSKEIYLCFCFQVFYNLVLNWL